MSEHLLRLRQILSDSISQSIENQPKDVRNLLSRSVLELLGNPSTEQTLNEVTLKELVAQVKEYKNHAYVAAGLPVTHSQNEFFHRMKMNMITRANQKNQMLLPLIHAEFPVPLENIPYLKEVRGKQMKGVTNVSGPPSAAELWLFDHKQDKLQTIERILAVKAGKSFLIDIYSDPVKGIFYPESSTMSLVDTKPSRAKHILLLASEGYEIKGRVKIRKAQPSLIPINIKSTS